MLRIQELKNDINWRRRDWIAWPWIYSFVHCYLFTILGIYLPVYFYVPVHTYIHICIYIYVYVSLCVYVYMHLNLPKPLEFSPYFSECFVRHKNFSSWSLKIIKNFKCALKKFHKVNSEWTFSIKMYRVLVLHST